MSLRTWNEILDIAPEFRHRLRQTKKRLEPHCRWYPYETLSNLDHLTPVFAHSAAPFEELAAGRPVLDLGSGDGDLAFLLEAAGYQVHALDHPRTNYNGMAGIRLLREELNSRVEILTADLDSALELGSCSLIFCLGVLYHVKSPLLLLEELARAADHCVLSTRVARQTPEGHRLEPHPVAYLLDDSELNADNSNFWVFTPSALHRLARRAGWSVLHMSFVGDARTSDPLSQVEHDERAFCLLKKRQALAGIELLEGWYESEGFGWRWTRREFSALAAIPSKTGTTLRLIVRLFVSGELLRAVGPITLRCRAANWLLDPLLLSEGGDITYRVPVPQQAAGGGSLLLQFSLDKTFLEASTGGARELGVIVHSIELAWQ